MTKKQLKVLVACEFSGTVRDAFNSLGDHIDAWSCDLLPTDVEGQHIQGDVRKILNNQDWDLIIAHPPCTFLTVSNAKNWSSLQANGKQQAAIDFVEAIYFSDCPHICVENPVGALSTRSRLGKASQYIQPFQFGHPEQKKTGLWLKGLPKLKGTEFIDVSGLPKKEVQRLHYLGPSKDRWKLRSTTYKGIAKAMAIQFSGYLLSLDN
jgi:site-specific DNA-cytosine methylase